MTRNTRCILLQTMRIFTPNSRKSLPFRHCDPPTTLKEAALVVFIISTGYHTHSTLTKTLSSYQNIGNVYHFDTNNSFEPELNLVPSKGKVGISATSTSLDASPTPRNETRSPEMSVICYKFSTQGAVSYERPCKLNPHTNWHHSDIAYCIQHCAQNCFPFELAALS